MVYNGAIAMVYISSGEGNRTGAHLHNRIARSHHWHTGAMTHRPPASDPGSVWRAQAGRKPMMAADTLLFGALSVDTYHVMNGHALHHPAAGSLR